MKILTVVGARPQFIKAAVVSHELRKNNTEILVHTGQHYDYDMSEQFFEELDIPKPDYNLGISGGTHAQMTGNMMIALETVMIEEKPDAVLVYGDTNSTLAAAISAAKLHFPVLHVEGGVRTHCKTNPEEINRICTDHLSAKILVCSESGMDELNREGLIDRAVLVGDPMYDAFVKYSSYMSVDKIKMDSLIENKKIEIPKKFYYLTCHREENSNEMALKEILNAMNRLEVVTVYPVHPRNRERVIEIVKKYGLKNIVLTSPVGYLESICLVNNSLGVITDSGGLQREAFFAKKKCVTVLDFVVWQETMVGNRNQLSKANAEEIIGKIKSSMTIDESYKPFGDGHSYKKIVKAIEEF